MFDNNDIQVLKETTKEFFERISIEGTLGFMVSQDDADAQMPQTITVTFETKEPRILIGEQGQTLFELQQLLAAVLKKKTGKQFFVNLDINNYKKRKIEYLKEAALSLADEVSLSKQEKYLPPMPSYERRIIHMELSKRADIITESIGEGQDRKIVIRPA